MARVKVGGGRTGAGKALSGRDAKNADDLAQALLRWFDREKRDLPWRRTSDPYRIWISEIMLQQTRVEAAGPYYERFIAGFPTVESLAAARSDAVMKAWEGLGYYSRARNLHRAAQVVAKERKGALPHTALEWQALPGVGRYTAGAIASIAYGEQVAALDGNGKRVLARVFLVEEPIGEAAAEEEFWRLAESLVPARRAGDFNQALMELGARVCLPRKPRCEACPIAPRCKARKLGRQSELPKRRPKKAIPHYQVAVAAIWRNGRCLIGKRPEGGLLGGLWEFPGGKIEHGETHEVALKRECREELGVEIHIGEPAAKVDHAYSHFRVTLHVYRCQLPNGTPQPLWHTRLRWVRRAEFALYAFPASNRKFIGAL